MLKSQAFHREITVDPATQGGERGGGGVFQNKTAKLRTDIINANI